MFKLIHNKKGVSLIELIITVSIVGLVLVLSSTIFSMFSDNHQASERRWQVQNAVRLASSKFETNANLITNSKQLDIFYDDTVAQGIIYNEADGTFSWKNGGQPYVMPSEGYADGDYSYIFSTPAYSTDDVYLGYFLFIKNFNEETSTLFLDDEGFGNVPVEIELSVTTDFLPPVRPAELVGYEHDKEFDALVEQEKALARHNYRSNGIEIVMKSGNEDIVTYEVVTSYVLENINATKQVGMENGKLIFDASWLKEGTVVAHPCGWSDEYINALANKSAHGFPNATTKYGDSGEYTYTFKEADLQKTGNVLRFLSPLSDMSIDSGEGQGSTTHKASCIQTWLFEDGTVMGERVLDNFRNFRDNVLRGTEIGDWFISFYYNDMSPFMIEKTAFLRPVYKAISEPLSYVCDFIANL